MLLALRRREDRERRGRRTGATHVAHGAAFEPRSSPFVHRVACERPRSSGAVTRPQPLPMQPPFLQSALAAGPLPRACFPRRFEPRGPMSESKALSPIADEDYGAIEAAVMETQRGRWFPLGIRPGATANADTNVLLGAIERLENAVSREREADRMDRLRFDLVEMARAITSTKREIAAIRPRRGRALRSRGGVRGARRHRRHHGAGHVRHPRSRPRTCRKPPGRCARTGRARTSATSSTGARPRS